MGAKNIYLLIIKAILKYSDPPTNIGKKSIEEGLRLHMMPCTFFFNADM